jgi:hypothetical protein
MDQRDDSEISSVPLGQGPTMVPVYYVPQSHTVSISNTAVDGHLPVFTQQHNPALMQQNYLPAYEGYSVDPQYQQAPFATSADNRLAENWQGLQSQSLDHKPEAQFNDTASVNSEGMADDAGFKSMSRAHSIDVKSNPNVPEKSYALIKTAEDMNRKKTNTGNTDIVMAILSEMWIFHIIFMLGGLYLMTFIVEQGYTDEEVWNSNCWYKIGALLPLPYTFICFFGLVLPFRTPKFLYDKNTPKRRIDNFYILTVTKGANKEAVYRAWNAHKHLEGLHPSIRVHVLTDEPYFFENINCYTCPKSFHSGRAKYKARALEWYRQTMRFTEHDWILHLDEESVIDDASVKACLEFIWYETDCHWGQGIILYNQYRYWTNWFFTVADALRVGDDLSRFAMQYSYFRRPIFGAHGSFLLTNGLVENAVTWNLGSLTEDYQFAVHAWNKGFKCGKVPGIIREQSPQTILDFMKQRRRWYVGISRLPSVLPKVWAFFWTIGSLALYGTVISVITSIYFKTPTPRWFGLVKDFTFVVFVYLYILGIFIQDIDKGVFPLLVIIRIPLTFILQFFASILECVSVMYAIIFPPADFDVIKK